jgi:hypothetical protein
MNRKLLDYFMFFLLRDALPPGVIAEALQNAEHVVDQGGHALDEDTDMEVIENMLALAEAFSNRFENK